MLKLVKGIPFSENVVYYDMIFRNLNHVNFMKFNNNSLIDFMRSIINDRRGIGAVEIAVFIITALRQMGIWPLKNQDQHSIIYRIIAALQPKWEFGLKK